MSHTQLNAPHIPTTGTPINGLLCAETVHTFIFFNGTPRQIMSISTMMLRLAESGRSDIPLIFWYYEKLASGSHIWRSQSAQMQVTVCRHTPRPEPTTLMLIVRSTPHSKHHPDLQRLSTSRSIVRKELMCWSI
jgi:hypothetical protein